MPRRACCSANARTALSPTSPRCPRVLPAVADVRAATGPLWRVKASRWCTTSGTMVLEVSTPARADLRPPCTGSPRKCSHPSTQCPLALPRGLFSPKFGNVVLADEGNDKGEGAAQHDASTDLQNWEGSEEHAAVIVGSRAARAQQVAVKRRLRRRDPLLLRLTCPCGIHAALPRYSVGGSRCSFAKLKLSYSAVLLPTGIKQIANAVSMQNNAPRASSLALSYWKVGAHTSNRLVHALSE